MQSNVSSSSTQSSSGKKLTALAFNPLAPPSLRPPPSSTAPAAPAPRLLTLGRGGKAKHAPPLNIPKPFNLPSLKKEQKGLDPNVELVKPSAASTQPPANSSSARPTTAGNTDSRGSEAPNGSSSAGRRWADNVKQDAPRPGAIASDVDRRPDDLGVPSSRSPNRSPRDDSHGSARGAGPTRSTPRGDSGRTGSSLSVPSGSNRTGTSPSRVNRYDRDEDEAPQPSDHEHHEPRGSPSRDVRESSREGAEDEVDGRPVRGEDRGGVRYGSGNPSSSNNYGRYRDHDRDDSFRSRDRDFAPRGGLDAVRERDRMYMEEFRAMRAARENPDQRGRERGGRDRHASDRSFQQFGNSNDDRGRRRPSRSRSRSRSRGRDRDQYRDRPAHRGNGGGGRRSPSPDNERRRRSSWRRESQSPPPQRGGQHNSRASTQRRASPPRDRDWRRDSERSQSPPPRRDESSAHNRERSIDSSRHDAKPSDAQAQVTSLRKPSEDDTSRRRFLSSEWAADDADAEMDFSKPVVFADGTVVPAASKSDAKAQPASVWRAPKPAANSNSPTDHVEPDSNESSDQQHPFLGKVVKRGAPSNASHDNNASNDSSARETSAKPRRPWGVPSHQRPQPQQAPAGVPAPVTASDHNESTAAQWQRPHTTRTLYDPNSDQHVEHAPHPRTNKPGKVTVMQRPKGAPSPTAHPVTTPTHAGAPSLDLPESSTPAPALPLLRKERAKLEQKERDHKEPPSGPSSTPLTNAPTSAEPITTTVTSAETEQRPRRGPKREPRKKNEAGGDTKVYRPRLWDSQLDQDDINNRPDYKPRAVVVPSTAASSTVLPTSAAAAAPAVTAVATTPSTNIAPPPVTTAPATSVSPVATPAPSESATSVTTASADARPPRPERKPRAPRERPPRRGDAESKDAATATPASTPSGPGTRNIRLTKKVTQVYRPKVTPPTANTPSATTPAPAATTPATSAPPAAAVTAAPSSSHSHNTSPAVTHSSSSSSVAASVAPSAPSFTTANRFELAPSAPKPTSHLPPTVDSRAIVIEAQSVGTVTELEDDGDGEFVDVKSKKARQKENRARREQEAIESRRTQRKAARDQQPESAVPTSAASPAVSAMSGPSPVPSPRLAWDQAPATAPVAEPPAQTGSSSSTLHAPAETTKATPDSDPLLMSSATLAAGKPQPPTVSVASWDAPASSSNAAPAAAAQPSAAVSHAPAHSIFAPAQPISATASNATTAAAPAVTAAPPPDTWADNHPPAQAAALRRPAPTALYPIAMPGMYQSVFMAPSQQVHSATGLPSATGANLAGLAAVPVPASTHHSNLLNQLTMNQLGTINPMAAAQLPTMQPVMFPYPSAQHLGLYTPGMWTSGLSLPSGQPVQRMYNPYGAPGAAASSAVYAPLNAAAVGGPAIGSNAPTHRTGAPVTGTIGYGVQAQQYQLNPAAYSTYGHQAQQPYGYHPYTQHHAAQQQHHQQHAQAQPMYSHHSVSPQQGVATAPAAFTLQPALGTFGTSIAPQQHNVTNARNFGVNASHPSGPIGSFSRITNMQAAMASQAAVQRPSHASVAPASSVSLAPAAPPSVFIDPVTRSLHADSVSSSHPPGGPSTNLALDSIKVGADPVGSLSGAGASSARAASGTPRTAPAPTVALPEASAQPSSQPQVALQSSAAPQQPSQQARPRPRLTSGGARDPRARARPPTSSGPAVPVATGVGNAAPNVASLTTDDANAFASHRPPRGGPGVNNRRADQAVYRPRGPSADFSSGGADSSNAGHRRTKSKQVYVAKSKLAATVAGGDVASVAAVGSSAGAAESAPASTVSSS